MKLLVGAAVAALFMATPAMAQTNGSAQSACAALPAPLGDMPDGATATRQQLDAFTTRFNAWAEETNGVLACRRAEAEAARARADALTVEFNTANTGLRTAITAWTAEVEEFNARAPEQRRRDPRAARGQ